MCCVYGGVPVAHLLSFLCFVYGGFFVTQHRKLKR
jgi:uncharacterized protein YneF (UPF0154 family)